MDEASYFPGVHFVLGSWYRSDEISRRGGIFYVGLTLGTLTAGLIQSAASGSLDGAHGIAGWRWSFIINAIITLPLALVGYVIWPGTPAKPNRLFLSAEELQLSRDRLERHGAKAGTHTFSFGLLRKVFTNSRIWLLIIWDIFFFNTSANSAAMLLWLKSLHRYSTPKLNQLGTIPPALGIFYVLFTNFSADLFFPRPCPGNNSCVSAQHLRPLDPHNLERSRGSQVVRVCDYIFGRCSVQCPIRMGKHHTSTQSGGTRNSADRHDDDRNEHQRLDSTFRVEDD